MISFSLTKNSVNLKITFGSSFGQLFKKKPYGGVTFLKKDGLGLFFSLASNEIMRWTFK